MEELATVLLVPSEPPNHHYPPTVGGGRIFIGQRKVEGFSTEVQSRTHSHSFISRPYLLFGRIQGLIVNRDSFYCKHISNFYYSCFFLLFYCYYIFLLLLLSLFNFFFFFPFS